MFPLKANLFLFYQGFQMYTKFVKFIIALSIVFVLFYIAIYCNYHKVLYSKKSKDYGLLESKIVITTVVCGIERTEEAIVMIKSALIFSYPKHHLMFVIITEAKLFQVFEEKLKSFLDFNSNFSFRLIEVSYPNAKEESWRNLFKPCASLRLFLPSLQLNDDMVLYVDCDSVFLSPPHSIFQLFQRFNSSQLAGLASESENINIGWYPR